MATFAVAFLIFSGLVLIASVPLLIVALRRQKARTVRHFLIAGGLVALLCAATSAGSERLVRQCREAGNPTCLDYGASGLQLLLLAGYAVVAWIVAYNISRE